MATHKIYIDRKMAFDDGVTWTTVPGLYPDAYVPEAALADAQAEIARLTAGLSLWISRAEQAEAERDAARAEVAMAYEAAADHCWNKRDLLANAEKKQVAVGLTGRDYYWRRLEAELLSRSIRALTPADAKAALEARDRAKVAEGMREAAGIVKGWWANAKNTHPTNGVLSVYLEKARAGIMSSAEPEMSETSGDTA